ncbi:hypothetical protein HOO54_08450 [Bacillus sp. WMMC1349]|uniref:hypothetical protein n=1 Tax=Bacillus sp. WMMC1349 TaxID=2736254 RepID=UPI001553CF22|nr:hypothetical protein [Bacillus sp. WMMC1349]NPC92249.1 hypothetical protein [Bacillus sp. WMMC1349]
MKKSSESIDNFHSYLHYLIERNDLDGMIELFHHQIQASNLLNSCTGCKNEEWFKGFLMFPCGHHEHSLAKNQVMVRSAQGSLSSSCGLFSEGLVK